ncbi:NAD(P)H-dependent oxidoreductase [Ketobacter sp. MCCC 1A13808]|nr:NAD(P)H-dependent oxidoreductase [Ketobacter sp. MCCC 1A13808]MVF11766.1 NAD(P)H-dependent oxidoreductase [Ketobacter sp. MCCC 1A13808]RLP55373.1 MAG: flavodoxin family protein [Ketobacter sp.]
MSKRILVLAANPKKDSYTNYLAAKYTSAAQQQNQARLIQISDLEFDLNLAGGFTESHALEDALQSFQADIEWCEHLAIFTPVWWGSLPAKLKGLIDRAFLPGFAFQYEKGNPIPRKLLKGKTARIVMMMDTPPWYYFLIQGAPATRQLKTTTLKFVGFRSVKSKMIGPIINSTARSRSKWADEVSKLGYAGN